MLARGCVNTSMTVHPSRPGANVTKFVITLSVVTGRNSSPSVSQ
jgi:hypothetical protein